ncbi:hypothetical protein COY27_06955 [Candidatus Woesearchaeota archaeon CG_4_10_14_0_2_um_filter_33_13]|nr:MAG: hypothetical protein COY27_06955 [Candidatus Woesearchaeota archaeon CG_4_10_14_0_2_um_filter_33_13]
MKKLLIILSLLSVLVLLVACSQELKQADVTEKPVVESNSVTNVVVNGDIAQVAIENYNFMPTNLEVMAGTTVEWVNKDSADHTVSFENGDFEEVLPEGATTTYTFTESGEYRYFCKFHPGMQGSVIVN